MITAREIMNKEIITVTPEMSVAELGRLFIEKDISSAPVIDEYDQLYGIVTENDLIRMERPFHIPTIIQFLDSLIPLQSDAVIEEEIRSMAASSVDDICSKVIVTVTEDTTFQEIAAIMTERKIHFIPVLKDDKLVGTISKRDMIKAMTFL